MSLFFLEFLLFYLNNVNVISNEIEKECSFLKEESDELVVEKNVHDPIMYVRTQQTA